MDEYKLKIFCAVVETRSFSQASKVMNVTQPAVTLQIQALEELYETRLLDRTGNFIRPTAAGEVLYRYAKEVLSRYAEAGKDLGRITGSIKGSISIGASTTIGNYVLPGIIAGFKQKHPRIHINLLIGNTARIKELLLSGSVNVGFVEGAISGERFTVEPVISDELVVVIAPSHPLSSMKTVSLLDLTQEPFIIRENGSSTRQLIEKFFLSYGITLSDLCIPLVLGSTESIKTAVEKGMGISMLSKWAVKKELKNNCLKIIIPREEGAVRRFSLLIPSGSIFSHAQDEFLSYLRYYPYEKVLSEYEAGKLLSPAHPEEDTE